MQEVLFFILGIVVGGIVMTILMACLQLNRINELEIRCFELEKEKLELQNEK